MMSSRWAVNTGLMTTVYVATALYKETEMKTKAFWSGLCLLLLSACGPIIGSMMVAGTGVKDVTVVSGDLTSLKAGSRVAVVGPFAITAEAFYICRGEEAANFASSFVTRGLFQAELSVDQRFPDSLPKVQDWQGKTPAQVQELLGLDAPPDLMLSGTILLLTGLRPWAPA